MNILIVSRGVPHRNDPNYGIFEYDQARALRDNGHNVSFIALDFRSLRYKRAMGFFRYTRYGVNIYELSLPIGMYRRLTPLLQILLECVFKRTVKESGYPDIIHAHFYFMASLATILKKRYNIPLVVTEHSSKLNRDRRLISGIDKRLARNGYKSANKIIAVSSILSKRLTENFNLTNVTVINNIVDLDKFYYVDRPKRSGFVFLSVGNLISLKGFHTLIEAFHKAGLGDDVKLRIIGDGPEREKLKKVVAELGLNSQISLLGSSTREEIQEQMAESDAFVLASSSETFGVAFIEAMVTGLPVIATKCGGPEEFVNPKNGILVPINDTDALSKALITMRETAKEYDAKTISLNCGELFSPKYIASHIETCYNTIIG